MERAKQKQRAISALLPGHSTLLVQPSGAELKAGLMKSKLNKSPGGDGVTAELIRAAVPCLRCWLPVVWTWMVYRLHVAQSWKNGMIIALVTKIRPGQDH